MSRDASRRRTKVIRRQTKIHGVEVRFGSPRNPISMQICHLQAQFSTILLRIMRELATKDKNLAAPSTDRKSIATGKNIISAFWSRHRGEKQEVTVVRW